MAETLYTFLKSATQQQSSSADKVQFGYTVDSYKGVLEALQRNKNALVQNRGSVYGQQYQQGISVVFDENNFGDSYQSTLWKVELMLQGAMPIQNKNYPQIYEIRPTQGYTIQRMSESGVTNQCPPIASIEHLPQNELIVGAFLSLTHLQKYFEHFYENQLTDTSQKFNVAGLIQNKLLRCQIVNPSGGGLSSECTVVGYTSTGDDSRLLLNPALFATSNFSTLGMDVYVQLAQGGVQKVCPAGESYMFGGGENCEYNAKTATIKGYNSRSIRTKITADGNSTSTMTNIVQFSSNQFWVKVYISDRAAAEGLVPKGLRDTAYTPLTTNMFVKQFIGGNYDADVKAMLECIDEQARADALYKWTPEDIKKDTGFSFPGKGYNGEKRGLLRCTTPLGLTSKRAGRFTIPRGYPMYLDPRNNSIASGKERNDTAILSALGAKFREGKMDAAWYKKRLEIASQGTIQGRCQGNGRIGQKFTTLFQQIYNFYSRAASLYNFKYNSNKPTEQQVTAGLMLLKCAPALCVISSFIRESNSNARHEHGQAMDFDAAGNGTTTDFEENLNRQIVKKMTTAYRPLLHYLYKGGGTWFGAYKVKMRGGTRKYDSMHIEF